VGDGLVLVFEAAFGEDAFDGHIAVEAFVPGAVNGTDAALADLAFDVVTILQALGKGGILSMEWRGAMSKTGGGGEECGVRKAE